MAIMQAWQYSSAAGGLEKNMKINNEAPRPPPLGKDQAIVEVISMSLNPVDYKVPELGMAAKMMISMPATPGQDFCGRVSTTNIDGLKIGQIIFGSTGKPPKYGSLGQYMVVNKGEYAELPEGVSPDHAASIGIAGRTAWQSIKPNVKSGDKVFINGGSGGTGTYGIQIAKALGCHVTTSCSEKNIQLCKSLGADEVLDYKAVNISEKLKDKGEVFTLVFDTVGSPYDLYTASSNFLKPDGKFVQVGAAMSLGAIKSVMSRTLLPGFLGGGKRPISMLVVQASPEDLSELANWVKEGKIKPVIDSTWEFEDAAKAFAKLKTGRAVGKIIVKVEHGKH